MVVRNENQRISAHITGIKMNAHDETIYYGDYIREATYEDEHGNRIPFKDKNGFNIRYFDVLIYAKHNHYFHVRKDDDYQTVLLHIPTKTVEKLTPELAAEMERL